MSLNPDNPVVALCASGMQVDGEPRKALALFERAWALRTDDVEASVAAHFMARHQPTPAAALHWNELALRHADAVTDGRAGALLPSLCLNLADSYRVNGRLRDAEAAARRGLAALNALPADDGYVAFVRMGLERMLQLLRHSPAPAPTPETP